MNRTDPVITTTSPTTDQVKSAAPPVVAKFDAMLERLGNAQPLARTVYQTDVFQLAEAMMSSESGLAALDSRAHRFTEFGVFEGGPWSDPGRLQAPLVAGSLRGAGVFPVVETLSELRVLAIARGDMHSSTMSAEHARRFLTDVMALNLDMVFPRGTEEERIAAGPHHDSNLRLFARIAEQVGLQGLRREVIEEIEQICAQRPIMTSRVRRMIDMAGRIPTQEGESEDPRLANFAHALQGPSPIAKAHGPLADYRQALRDSDPMAIEREAVAFAGSMEATGLVWAETGSPTFTGRRNSRPVSGAETV